MKWKKMIVQIYLCMMFGIFPLYYQNKYYDMGEAKYAFFSYATIVMLLLLIGTSCLARKSFSFKTIKGQLERMKENLTKQDWIVLVYMLVVILSWLISPFRKDTWMGSPGWYMGLLSQLLFCGIYFAVSKYFSKNRWTMLFVTGCTLVVFVIAYLHRFQIDPLKLYEDLSARNQLNFLGTIGQATWYSSYLSVVFPMVIGYYIFKPQRDIKTEITEKILVGIVVFFGFATSVTQNSDSIYIGLGAALLFFLWFSVEERIYWNRYLEVLILGLSAISITGMLQSVFRERIPELGKLSVTLTQGYGTWVLLGFLSLVYFLSICLEMRCRNKPDTVRSFRKMGRVLRVMAVLAVLLVVIGLALLIFLITKEVIILNESNLNETGYFIFEDDWGNMRGVNWKYAVRIFQEYSLPMKLFGCGPDGLCFYTDVFHLKEVKEFWGDVIVTNVHNEWLTALVNLGILGALSYMAIFITSVMDVCKNWRENPLLLAAGAAVLAYMGHNFFCYQQCVCTSLIFIVIGASSYYNKTVKTLRRKGEKGKECIRRYLPKR